ncbi:Elongation factor 2 [Mortierella sp. AD094]|nr:Elongation factor 2 [Mortierella sp. AD094]
MSNPLKAVMQATSSAKGVSYPHGVRESCVAVFQWATREGVLAEEQMRGCLFNIMDVMLTGGATHYGGGQFCPAYRNAIHSSALITTPGLMDPFGGIYSVLNKRRGQVFSEEQHPSFEGEELVRGIRERKDLEDDIPGLENYMDKLYDNNSNSFVP